MKKPRSNSMMYNRPKDDGLVLGVGVRSSFVEEDNPKSQDTENESSSSDFEIPNLVKPMPGGGYNIMQAGTKTISMPISVSASLGGAQETAETGLQNTEYIKSGNVKIQQYGPEPHQSSRPHHFNSDTYQHHSGHNQKCDKQQNNHEQGPQTNHDQEHQKFSPIFQHLNQVYSPQYQHSGLGYGQQICQFPATVDSLYIPIYQQQVQASPSPQPTVYHPNSQSAQYGQPLLIQPSPLVAPPEVGLNKSTSTIPTKDQQQYSYQEVSSSDTQSVTSVGSAYPSVVSTPVFGSYYDYNLGNQLLISPISNQSYPTSQVVTQNVVPSHEIPSFYLNTQGCSVASDMRYNVSESTKMTMHPSIPRRPQVKLETASANTHVNITPTQRIKTEIQASLTTKGRDSSIHRTSYSYKEEEHEKHSNLYVHWTSTAEQLMDELEQKNLEVHSIQTTIIKGLWNVVFDSHSSARKAFTTQRELQIRMVPPRRSKKNWFRNPSPKFLVQYETKCRLDVRQGKAVVHDLVGVLLMSRASCQERKGCHVWADQLKGHRIRIVGCVGKFMFPSKRVIDMKEIPQKPVGNEPIGWVSYRNRHTREEYVTRISGNLLQEYIYNGETDFQCTNNI